MKKKDLIIYVFLFAILIPLLFYFKKINQEQDSLIFEKGIETIGTVIDRSYGSDNTGRQFSIRFDFQVGDKTYIGYTSLGNNRHYYDKAIIGMKYLVRYIPEEPNKNSKIYIDNPVMIEFENIKKERTRILNQYESGEKFISHSRPLNEVSKILGLEPHFDN